MPSPYDDLMGYAPQEEEPGWVSRLANNAIFAPLQWIGESLGKPAQALYGTLDALNTGEIGDFGAALANLIPFSDTFGITSDEPGKGLINTKQLSGQDMLRQWGAIDDEDSWGNWGAGLALDVLSDPMNFLTFGSGALSKAGLAAKKAGTLDPTLLGRIQKGQGGIVGVKSTPWWLDLMARQSSDPFAVIGGKDSIGGWGEGLAKFGQKTGEAATRWTVPGTEFSPVAFAQSKLRPFMGHTGTPEWQVAAGGGKLEGKTLEMTAAGRGRQMDFALDQSDALNALKATGMSDEAASHALWRAGISKSETGTALMQPNLLASQRQIIEDFAAKAEASRGIYDIEADVYRKTGGALKDINSPHQKYEHLEGAGYAGRLRGPEMERSDLGKMLAYGSARLDEFARDPDLAGYAATKTKGVPFDQAAATAKMASAAATIAQTNADDILQRFGQYIDPVTLKPLATAPPDLVDLLKYADPNVGLKEAKKIADYLAKRPAGPLYKPDMASSRLSYAESRAKLGAGNLTALQAFANEAKPLSQALTAAGDTRDVMTLTKALETAGLSMDAAPELLSRVQALGKGGTLDDLAVPSKLVDNLKKEINGPTPRAQTALGKLAGAFRYGVTVPFPANLTRNWMDTLLQQGMAGQSIGRNLGVAGDYFRNALTDPALHAKAQKAFEAGLQHNLFDDQIRAFNTVGFTDDASKVLNIRPTQAPKSTLESLGEQFAPVKDAFKTPGIKGKVVEPVKEYLKAMEGAHGFQNKVTRLQQIMNLMDEGYTPSAAAEKVKVTQLDYNRLSPWMRDTGRTAIPFANFSMQNLRRTGDLLQNDPGRLNALLSVANSGRADGEYVPPYVSGGAAVPIGGAEEGKQRFISSFGLPMEDEAIGALSALLSGRPGEGIRRAASASNPLIKTIYEQATGTQVFSGRPLEDLRPSGTLAGMLGDNRLSRGLSQAVQGTPGSRILSTSDRLLDMERTGPLAALLNLGTGIRVTDVDQQMATDIAAREALQDLLKRSGQFKSRESVYLDRRKVADPSLLTPELQQLLEQYRTMERRSQAAAKERSAVR